MPGPTSFVDLMALSTVRGNHTKGADTYVSRFPAFNPGLGSAFGGHVFAQAVWAASQSVEEGMVVHNVHGYFTLPGLVDRPYLYAVTHISEGKSYCTRSVTVRQPTSPVSLLPSGCFNFESSDKPLGKICFACICSFKRDEISTTSHQAKMELQDSYRVVIKDKEPHDHLKHPRLDTPWYHSHRQIHGQVEDFPGLDMRKVNMSEFNKGRDAINHRQLSYYRVIGSIPWGNFNMSACGHLYASDRNSLYIVSNAVGFGDQVKVMGSLSHSVVFHVSSKELVLKEGDWWCQESWTSRSEGGRGMVESRIVDKNGLHVASTWQDGLVRKAEREIDQKQRMLFLRAMETDGRLFKKATADSKL